MDWYAIAVRPQAERAVQAALAHKSYETYFPLVLSERRWSDRIKRTESALIPGYIFCRFDSAERLPIMTTPGVREIVGFGRQAAPVSESELLALRQVIESGLKVESCDFLRQGDRVEVIDGPMQGLQGLLLEVKGPLLGQGRDQFRDQCRVVVSVNLLQRSVAVEIDRNRVRRMESKMTMTARGN